MIRVAFDIGGVLSKYPDVLRPLLKLLVDAGAEVFCVTDMHPLDLVLETLRLNNFDFLGPARVLVADYQTHVEGCKAVLLQQHQIDLLVDDFIGYLAEPGPIRCLVMPDSSKPYYHSTWKTVSGEADFGRKIFKRFEGPHEE